MAGATDDISLPLNELFSTSETKETNTADSPEHKRKKKTALVGCFKYRVPFNAIWKEQYPVEEVKGDQYKFYCLPCGDKALKCGYSREARIKDHCGSKVHKESIKS